MTPLVKICGLSTPETLDAAIQAGADMVGFVHFPKSPRHVGLDLGRALSGQARGRAERVVLLVDPSDALLDAVVDALDPEAIQLHGAETPERVAGVKARTGRQAWKAVGIGAARDLDAVGAYAGVADRILLDAKPPKGPDALPGGNGVRFDWGLLARLDPAIVFMLSGGLDADVVGQAVAMTGARAVDVSSGVELRPGVKDPEKIAAFVRAARAAFAAGASKD